MTDQISPKAEPWKSEYSDDCSEAANKRYWLYPKHTRPQNEIHIDHAVIEYIGWRALREDRELVRYRLGEIEGVVKSEQLHDDWPTGDYIGWKITFDPAVSFDEMKKRINFALCISDDSFGGVENFNRWLAIPRKAKFRKRPVVIEAYQTNEPLDIPTLEGVMHAEAGDWIITGVKGEQYPCKPDIFEASYERVNQ